VKMDNPNITMEEYIRLEEEKSHRRGKVLNWETATYGKIWDNEDVHDLGSVETEFPAIVFNNMLTSEATFSCEPTVSSLTQTHPYCVSAQPNAPLVRFCTTKCTLIAFLLTQTHPYWFSAHPNTLAGVIQQTKH
ncbi:hypothetical protein Tco_1496609, partial [Tanacetum coccineum]